MYYNNLKKQDNPDNCPVSFIINNKNREIEYVPSITSRLLFSISMTAFYRHKSLK